MLYILFILLAIILVLAVLLYREFRLTMSAGMMYRKLSNDYDALDQGLTETQDAYATDQAQWAADGEKFRAIIEEYRASLQRKAQRLQSKDLENAGLRRQLDIAQVIIAKHDANCLPHIVLSGMEKSLADIPDCEQ